MDSTFPIDKFTSTSNSIFENISTEVKEKLKKLMVEKTYKKGQIIFLENSFPAGVYYLNEGLIKKYKTDNLGKEHVLYLCTDGELLGYSSLLCSEAYPDSAATLESSKISFIPKELFLNTIYSSNELMVNILSSLSHEFGVMVNSVTVFAQMTVKERLALILLILTAKFKQRNIGKIEIVLSREDLANMVGTAIETLVRLLHVFNQDKLIELKGKKIIVLNSKELINISRFY